MKKKNDIARWGQNLKKYIDGTIKQTRVDLTRNVAGQTIS